MQRPVESFGNLLITAFLVSLIAACDGNESVGYQGYVEADYMRIAPRASGNLDRLSVHRGQQVQAGDELFAMDRDEAEATLGTAIASQAAAEAARNDALKGIRTEEQNVLHARLEQAEAVLELSNLRLDRRLELLKTNAVSQGQVDEARAAHERDSARVEEIRAAVGVGDLGQRPDKIAQLDAAVAMALTGRELAAWQLSERVQSAPVDALVFDTLYVAGEFISSGRPVVVLLPPDNRKVIFFVPETAVSSLTPGLDVRIECDGCSSEIGAKISFISPEAEFTPPVIYSESRREKLVFRAEARLVPGSPPLNPGLPVTVIVAAP